MSEDQTNLRPDVNRALLDEMQFWNRQLGEHTRIIRSGVDLGDDDIIREADTFVRLYDRLLARVNQPGITSNNDLIGRLVQQSKNFAAGLREFKLEVEEGIRECRIRGIVPADLVDHIRRELDYFVGKLDAITGGPIPTRKDLEIDNSNLRVSLVPRMLIDEVEGGAVCKMALEEVLFWLHISEDHAGLLADFFKPVTQAQFTRETTDFSNQFARFLHQVSQNMNQPGIVSTVIQPVAELNLSWISYLNNLIRDLSTCQLPEKQTNFWPALAAHISREQMYFQTLLQMLTPKVMQERC